MVPVVPTTNAPDDPADADALRGYADALLEAVIAAIPSWVERVVGDRYRQWAERPAPPVVLDEAGRAGLKAAAAIEPRLRELLTTDVDAQRTNPLAIVRSAVRFPTAVLQAADVPPVERDAPAVAMFPDDLYDLSPATFSDLGGSVHEPGIVWGAAKAHVILRRRRHE